MSLTQMFYDPSTERRRVGESRRRLLQLITESRDNEGIVDMTVGEIALALQFSKRYVYQLTAWLENAGLIVVYRSKTKRGENLSNLVVLASDYERADASARQRLARWGAVEFTTPGTEGVVNPAGRTGSTNPPPEALSAEPSPGSPPSAEFTTPGAGPDGFPPTPPFLRYFTSSENLNIKVLSNPIQNQERRVDLDLQEDPEDLEDLKDLDLRSRAHAKKICARSVSVDFQDVRKFWRGGRLSRRCTRSWMPGNGTIGGGAPSEDAWWGAWRAHLTNPKYAALRYKYAVDDDEIGAKPPRWLQPWMAIPEGDDDIELLRSSGGFWVAWYIYLRARHARGALFKTAKGMTIELKKFVRASAFDGRSNLGKTILASKAVLYAADKNWIGLPRDSYDWAPIETVVIPMTTATQAPAQAQREEAQPVIHRRPGMAPCTDVDYAARGAALLATMAK